MVDFLDTYAKLADNTYRSLYISVSKRGVLMPYRPRIFTSFIQMLFSIAKGKINEDDLDSGLFYFDEPRHVIIADGLSVSMHKQLLIKGIVNEFDRNLAFAILKVSVLKADTRVAWKSDNSEMPGFRTLTQLNQLLTANGYKKIIVRLDSGRSIAKMIEKSGNDIVVSYAPLEIFY